jgi:hypothetical protein
VDTVVQGNGADACFLNSNAGTMNAAVDRCTFRDGTNNGAANLWVRISGTGFVRNCVVDEGNAGIQLEGGVIKVYHCTVVSRDGQGVNAIRGEWPTNVHEVANCILDGFQVGFQGNNGVNLSNHHNLVRGTTSNYGGTITQGASNITGYGSAGFVTPTSGVGTGNFNLVAGSPAPGYGDPLVALAADRDNSSRPNPVATNPDIGAYESVLAPVSMSAFSIE